MRIIIDERHAAPGPSPFEPATNAAELGDALADDLRSDTEFRGQRRRRQRVEHIVLAGERDRQFCEELPRAKDSRPVSLTGSP